MTATFIELHIDGNGPILIDIMDISRVGPAHGDATGSRVVLPDGTVLDVREDARTIKAMMREAGVVRA